MFDVTESYVIKRLNDWISEKNVFLDGEKKTELDGFPIVESTLSRSKEEESESPSITKQIDTPFKEGTLNKMNCTKRFRHIQKKKLFISSIYYTVFLVH